MTGDHPTSPGGLLRLCVEHRHLHTGRAFLGGDHDQCAVCHDQGYSNDLPPAPSNYDYDTPPAASLAQPDADQGRT